MLSNADFHDGVFLKGNSNVVPTLIAIRLISLKKLSSQNLVFVLALQNILIDLNNICCLITLTIIFLPQTN